MEFHWRFLSRRKEKKEKIFLVYYLLAKDLAPGREESGLQLVGGELMSSD